MIATINNNKWSKVLVLFLVLLMLFFSFDIVRPQKADAFAQIVVLQAFGALVGIVLTAITGYTLAETWDLTIGDLDTLYNNVMSKLSGLDQAEFVAGLISFASTGLIPDSLVDKLQIGLVGNEVIDRLQTDYTGMQSAFSETSLSLLESELNTYVDGTSYAYCFDVIKYQSYQNWNDRYLVRTIGGTRTTEDKMVDSINIEKIEYVPAGGYGNYDSFEMTYEKIATNYVSDGAYTYPNRRVGVAFMIMDTYYNEVIYQGYSTCYGTSDMTKPYVVVGSSTYPNGLYDYHEGFYNTIPSYVFEPDIGYLPTVPGITDLDKGTVTIPVPVDTAVDMPAVPDNPTADDVISVNIPTTATGEGVRDVPIDETGTAGEVMPTDPALDMSMPTTTMLDLSPLYSTGLMDKFPFCIPQDILSVFSVFGGTSRTAPVLELPFVEDITIDIDFSWFDTVAQVARFMQYVIFLIALAFVTGKILL